MRRSEYAAGKTGFLFPGGDAAALAGPLPEVAVPGDNERSSLGRASRELVSLHFTRRVYLDKMLDLYGRLSAACVGSPPLNTDNSVSQTTA